ncbi:MAG: EAL domain-containing protein [Treponema sp.]|nr:EAL domain-containing protein [Treponema sp.]
MDYIIYFDIAALIISAVIFVALIFYKRFPTNNSRAFLLLTSSSIVGIVFNLFAIYTNHHCSLKYPQLTNIVNIIHILSINMIPVFYFYFILSMTHTNAEIPNPIKHILDGTVYYLFLSTITSPWTHWTMYNDENGNYCHGFGMTILYALAVFYIILGFIHCLKFAKKLKSVNFWFVVFFSIVILTIIVLQYLCPYYLIISFVISISLFICFLTLKNPLTYVYRSTDTYNKDAFTEFLSSSVYSKKPMSLIFFQLDNFDLLKVKIGTTHAYKLITNYFKHINNSCENKYMFHITGNTYGFFCESGCVSDAKADILLEISKTPFYINFTEDTSKTFSYRIFLSIYKIENLNIFRTLKDKHKFLLTNEIIDILKFAVVHFKPVELNVISYLDNSLFTRFYKKKEIIHTVQTAIQNESFEVFLQPIYSTKQKRFIGAESLIRLRGSDGNYIPPSEFIPESERNGDILRIGDISLKKTCEFIKETNLLEAGIETVNVNLSVMQCLQENSIEHLLEIIASYNLPKDIFRFEITESLATEDEINFGHILHSLTKKGVQLALDDYGTGFSNTARLMSYPFFEIKFDKSLIDFACKDEQNMIYLKHLINMANEKGMVTLAEGIEDEASAASLEDIGCSLIQGFYYAKPMNSVDFAKFIKNNKKVAF